MRLEEFLLMRHELVLCAVIVLILLAELFAGKGTRTSIIYFSIGIFLLNVVAGFIPTTYGSIFGGMYRTWELVVDMKNILNVGVFVVLLQSAKWLQTEENEGKATEFILLLLSTLLGMFFMISSGDFLMFYLGLELATIPIAALAAYEKHKEQSAEAGIKLILLAGLSSGITLFGISMLYGTNGSIFFGEVEQTFVAGNLQVLGFIFFLSGLAFKISLVPFHLWTADVYEGAPINVTSYLSVISKGAAVFILLILLFTVFRSITVMWTDMLYAIAILTMTIGNLFAIRQQNLKRFLAFSSIAQAGFILLGLIGGSVLGMTSVVYFVMIYIFSNLGAFGVISAISVYTGKENMDDYNGLYQTNPKLSLVLMLSLFSLAGIPPVAGFFGKFFLFAAAAQKGYYLLVIIATLNATISLYYYLLVVKAMFINKNEQPVPYFKSDNLTKIGIIICVAGMLVIGFASGIWDYLHSISFGI